MILVLIVSLLSILGMIALILFWPSFEIKGHHFQTFYFAPLFGAIVLLACQALPWSSLWEAFSSNGPMNPLKILILFLSMSALSLILDEAGLFSFLAELALKKGGKSQMRMFLTVYLVTSLLTVFTSNDVIILTFTPFLLSYCKKAKISPIPYLVEEFAAANTFSMVLLIGNPTNIYLSSVAGIDFLSYFKTMILPSLLAGGVTLLILFLLCHKELRTPLFEADVHPVLKNKPLAIFGLVSLGCATILLSLSNFLHFEMYLVSLSFALLSLLFALIQGIVRHHKKEEESFSPFLRSLKRIPYALIPFLLSMFVLVLSLQEVGIPQELASFFSRFDPIWGYGISSYLCCNLTNNIPMSVLYGEIIPFAEERIQTKAYYASIVGSNLGAILTPIGALAGIMWMSLLKEKGVKYSFFDFFWRGALVSLPSLAAALLGLMIIR